MWFFDVNSNSMTSPALAITLEGSYRRLALLPTVTVKVAPSTVETPVIKKAATMDVENRIFAKEEMNVG